MIVNECSEQKPLSYFKDHLVSRKLTKFKMQSSEFQNDRKTIRKEL